MLRRMLIAIAALVLIWAGLGWAAFVHPRTDSPSAADAVLILGSPRVNGRDAVALNLIRAGYAPNLVISGVLPQQLSLRVYCRDGLPGVHVYCFQPKPATTQGEAEEIARLADAHGWHSIIVVTSTYHVSRARMIVDRCFRGQVEMVPARADIGLGTWAYQFLYQTGAYAKAIVNPGC